MTRNPIWRESIAIYFAEGHGFPSLFLSFDHPCAGGVFFVVHSLPRRADVERLGEPVQSLRGDGRAAADLFFPARGQSGVRALALQTAAQTGFATRDNRSRSSAGANWDFFITHVGLVLAAGSAVVGLGRRHRAHAARQHRRHVVAALVLCRSATVFGAWRRWRYGSGGWRTARCLFVACLPPWSY